jgi:sterol desaturase/sphingolipid hydroxylase (fatty acid hydroxylase superfamily)
VIQLIYAGSFAAVAVAMIAWERAAPRRGGWRRPGIGRDLADVVLANAIPAAAVEMALIAGLATLSPDYSLGLAAPLPFAVELVALIALTELSFYAIHRAMHAVPWLWRIHRRHHTAEALDWLSGFRKNPLETVAHMAAPFVVIAVIGFSPEVWLTFGLLNVGFAAFTHANTRAALRWLEPFVVTPRYHAWHHAADRADQATNLAGKLPVFDRLFGSRRGDRGRDWPAATGLGEDARPLGRT